MPLHERPTQVPDPWGHISPVEFSLAARGIDYLAMDPTRDRENPARVADFGILYMFSRFGSGRTDRGPSLDVNNPVAVSDTFAAVARVLTVAQEHPIPGVNPALVTDLRSIAADRSADAHQILQRRASVPTL